MDEVGDLHHLLFLQSARGHRRRAEADAAGFGDRFGVERDGVLVDRDGGLVECLLGLESVDARGTEVNEKDMVVGAAGADRVSEHGEACREGLGIEDDLLGIFLERRLERLVEADSLGRDDLHERAALDTGEHLAVDLLGILFLAENESGAGAAQALVRGGGDEVGVGNGIGMRASRDETRDVSHVDEEESPDGIGDLAESREVDLARVGGSAGGDHLRFDLLGLFSEGVVVDAAVGQGDAVVGDFVEFAGEVGLVPVGEVASVREVHGEDAIAGLEDAEVDGHVGLAAAVGLDVGVVRAEELLGALDRKVLDDVDMFTSTVPTASGISLGILVGEAGTLSLHDRLAGEIFRCDQLDVFELAMMLRGDGGSDLRVGLGEGGVGGGCLGHGG